MYKVLAIEYCDNDAETNNIYTKNVYDAKNTNNIYSYQIWRCLSLWKLCIRNKMQSKQYYF